MSTVRRRIQRPPRQPTAVDARRSSRLQIKHERLAKEPAALKRWMAKLKRSFHAVEKQQLRIARLKRQLANLEQNG
jgi:hypothetical protein